MDRPLHWWYLGWWSMKGWRYHVWVMDDYGDAVLVGWDGINVYLA